MSIKKWIFTGLGWAVGGPIGAIIGYWIGRGIDNAAPQGESIGATHGPYHNTGTLDAEDRDSEVGVFVSDRAADHTFIVIDGLLAGGEKKECA